MLTCAVRGLCIVAVRAIEIVNSDVKMYQSWAHVYLVTCVLYFHSNNQ